MKSNKNYSSNFVNRYIIFHKLKFQLLDLSGNYLMRLTGDELYRTNKITTLLLHNNYLMSLGDRLNEVMPQLKTITLHNNKLQVLLIALGCKRKFLNLKKKFYCHFFNFLWNFLNDSLKKFNFYKITFIYLLCYFHKIYLFHKIYNSVTATIV